MPSQRDGTDHLARAINEFRLDMNENHRQVIRALRDVRDESHSMRLAVEELCALIGATIEKKKGSTKDGKKAAVDKEKKDGEDGGASPQIKEN